MLIGELADAAGMPGQTIRFYERQGLLPPPQRAANGYRNYDESTLTRLHFVQTAQAAGLTLAEIGSIIDLRDEGNVPCAHVATLIHSKLPTCAPASGTSPRSNQNSTSSSNAAIALIPPTAPTPISATFSPHLSSKPPCVQVGS